MTRMEKQKLYLIREIIIESYKEGIDLSNDDIDDIWNQIKIKKITPIDEVRKKVADSADHTN